MTDETRTLARFAADLAFESIPPHVRARAIDLVVDQIGVELGCSHLPWARQVRDMQRSIGGKPEATVLRYGDRLPLGGAAFVNATFGHSFEYDDANPMVHGHPGAELVPALLAVAERDRLPGRELLTAFVAAYEVRGRIGWAASPDLLVKGGPQYSTSCGPFGVAAGVARLLGLGAEGIRHAMGIAGSYSGGLMQYDRGGGSVKRNFAAIGCGSGIQAALLAQAGITGPEGILEGERGMLRMYASEYRPARLVAELGSLWTIEQVLFKPYCCCAMIQPAIDGLRTVVAAHGLKADAIEAVEVDYPESSASHTAIAAPKDLLEMQFSTAYALALTALEGRNTPKVYTLEALADPRVRAFAGRVTLRHDRALDPLFARGRFPARVTVRARNGERHEAMITDSRGSPGAPFTREDVDEKFRSQVADVLGEARCEALLGVLRGLETLDDAARIAPLACETASPSLAGSLAGR